jgi:preprotein translocase subunit SecE
MFAKIKGYFVGVYTELKRTTWPSRKTLVNYTIIVIASSAIAVAVLNVVDLGLTKGIEYIVNNAK